MWGKVISATPKTPPSELALSIRCEFMALEVLVSGNPIAAFDKLGFTSPTWYANAGLHTFNGVNIDSTIGFGGGLVFSFANAEGYAGLEIIDKTTFGFGVRYAIR